MLVTPMSENTVALVVERSPPCSSSAATMKELKPADRPPKKRVCQGHLSPMWDLTNDPEVECAIRNPVSWVEAGNHYERGKEVPP